MSNYTWYISRNCSFSGEQSGCLELVPAACTSISMPGKCMLVAIVNSLLLSCVTPAPTKTHEYHCRMLCRCEKLGLGVATSEVTSLATGQKAAQIASDRMTEAEINTYLAADMRVSAHRKGFRSGKVAFPSASGQGEHNTQSCQHQQLHGAKLGSMSCLGPCYLSSLSFAHAIRDVVPLQTNFLALCCRW